jgi:hypothetical protein
MRKEPQIFTGIQKQDEPVPADILDALSSKGTMKSITEKFRRYSRFVEAAYEGNMGAEEVMKFYMNAPDDKVEEFERAVKVEDNDRAWDIVQNFMGVNLVGIGSDQLTEGEVKFQGILKTTPIEVMGELQKLAQGLQETNKEAVLLPEEKWHVTLIHQSILKPFRKELKSMELPPAPAVQIIPKVEERPPDGEKRSWVVWLENQEEMRGYVNQLMQQLGGQPNPEPDRRFHVSLANLTGNPGDSVR